MARYNHDYEALLRLAQSRPGLYLLGAGTSGGMAPLGKTFWLGPSLGHLRDISAIPIDIPNHSLLTQRVLEAARGIGAADVYPGRSIRPGTDDFPYHDALQRMTDYHARTSLKHHLAKPLFKKQRSPNYEVFNSFFPSVLANYNHDGLAEAFCSRRHLVLSMHGTISSHFGSSWLGEFLAATREYDFPVPPDGLLMGVPETNTEDLSRLLLRATDFSPEFIVVIGYSFALIGNQHDDQVSLDWYLRRFRGFGGNVYVVDPNPDAMQAVLADNLRCRNVVAMKAYWNVLSHVFIQALYGPDTGRSLNYMHEKILDRDGNTKVYRT
jgi:hypothetical protein